MWYFKFLLNIYCQIISKINAILLLLQKNQPVSKKVFYRLNPVTEEFERVYPTRRERILIKIKNIALGVSVAAAILILLYILFDLPKEKQLRHQNRLLQEQVENLDNRLDKAINVMSDLADRDNNMYRAIMQIDPLTPSTRYAGLYQLNDSARSSDFSQLLDDKELVASVTSKLNLFERQVAVQSISFSQLAQALSTNKERLSHIPSIRPIEEKDMTQMASGYGWRRDPIYGTSKHHDGMDFSSPTGTNVYATGDGTVTKAAYDGAYGNCIDIAHGYNYLTRYAHLSQILVAPGQKVSRGDLIGKVGSTGKSTGSHLHYEVRFKNTPQNPVNYYFADLTPEQYTIMVQQAENAGHVMD